MLAASTEQTSLCGLLYCLAFHPATQLADWPRVASRPLFAHLQNFCCSGRLLEYNTILFLLVRLLTHGINRGITSLLAGLCFKMQHVMPPLPPCRLFLISPSFSLLSLSLPPPPCIFNVLHLNPSSGSGGGRPPLLLLHTPKEFFGLREKLERERERERDGDGK